MVRTMAEATRTELAVLGLLAWSGESSGYELHKRAERSVGFIWAPARSQLYAVLKRLASDGLVEGGGWRRPIGRTSGSSALRTRARDAARVAGPRRAARARGPRRRAAEAVLQRARRPRGRSAAAGRLARAVEERLATYREIEASFDGEEGADAAARLQTLRLGMALMRASLAWADETLEALAPHEARR